MLTTPANAIILNGQEIVVVTIPTPADAYLGNTFKASFDVEFLDYVYDGNGNATLIPVTGATLEGTDTVIDTNMGGVPVVNIRRSDTFRSPYIFTDDPTCNNAGNDKVEWLNYVNNRFTWIRENPQVTQIVR